MRSGDDLPTVAAAAVLAFASADVAHEVIGHGAGYLARIVAAVSAGLILAGILGPGMEIG
jgi:hypothetical protein